MDPNAQLAAIRVAMKSGAHQAALDGMADLDEWLSKGGFQPAAWIRQPAEFSPDREGQTEDGRPYKLIGNQTDPHKLYPKNGSIQFGCWPVLVLETGGYNDIEARNPWTGETIWAGGIWDGPEEPDGPTDLARALRRLADSIEQSGWTRDAELTTN